MEKLGGDAGKFRGWLFDLTVALGQLDSDLQFAVRHLTENEEMRKMTLESWDPFRGNAITKDLYEKYRSDLYSVLVSLTEGESKGLLKNMVDLGHRPDGFKGLKILQ